MLPDTLCPVPWVNLSIDVNGSVRPCCKFEQPNKSSDRNLGNLKDSSLAEVWNSKQMQMLREDFLNGKKPKECSQCWSEEAVGIESLRKEFVRDRLKPFDIDYTKLKVDAPKALDLKLSNLCNSKCRICGPVASSLWFSEIEKYAPHEIGDLLEEKEFLLANKITLNKENMAEFQNWLSHLEHVELFGGEPLISNENRELEELMIKNNVAHKIALHYNTNITLFNDHILQTWKQFRKVSICLSLDDIEERLEYQRFPSKWNSVYKNLKKYAHIKDDQIKPMLFCSVSNYNIYYLDEYIKWVTLNLPNLEYRFNLVHDSPEFCITNLPVKIKSIIERKLNSSNLIGEDKTKLNDVINFMNSKEPDISLWDKFIKATSVVDQRRNQCFSNTFQEYFNCLDLNK